MSRQIEVVPGTHLVASAGGVIVVVAHRFDTPVTADSVAARALTTLLGIVGQATSNEPRRSGRTVARLATNWLMGLENGDEDEVEFGVITPGDTGIAVFLHGGVTAVLASAERTEVLRGSEAGFTVDRVVTPAPGVGAGLFVDEAGVRAETLPARGVFALTEGTAPGGGAVLWFGAAVADSGQEAGFDRRAGESARLSGSVAAQGVPAASGFEKPYFSSTGDVEPPRYGGSFADAGRSRQGDSDGGDEESGFSSSSGGTGGPHRGERARQDGSASGDEESGFSSSSGGTRDPRRGGVDADPNRYGNAAVGSVQPHSDSSAGTDRPRGGAEGSADLSRYGDTPDLPHDGAHGTSGLSRYGDSVAGREEHLYDLSRGGVEGAQGAAAQAGRGGSSSGGAERSDESPSVARESAGGEVQLRKSPKPADSEQRTEYLASVDSDAADIAGGSAADDQPTAYMPPSAGDPPTEHLSTADDRSSGFARGAGRGANDDPPTAYIPPAGTTPPRIQMPQRPGQSADSGPHPHVPASSGASAGSPGVGPEHAESHGGQGNVPNYDQVTDIDLQETVVPGARALDGAGSEEVGPGVVIKGFKCARDHLNDPRVSFCAVCGIRMDQLTCVLTDGVRPPLGLLLLDDGTSFVLDNDCVLGREPEHAEAVARGARPVRLEDRSGGMSRAHAEIRLINWDVTVVDGGSTNGTHVRQPGHQDWSRAIPGHPVKLAPGAQVQLGSRVVTFDSQHGQL